MPNSSPAPSNANTPIVGLEGAIEVRRSSRNTRAAHTTRGVAAADSAAALMRGEGEMSMDFAAGGLLGPEMLDNVLQWVRNSGPTGERRLLKSFDYDLITVLSPEEVELGKEMQSLDAAAAEASKPGRNKDFERLYLALAAKATSVCASHREVTVRTAQDRLREQQAPLQRLVDIENTIRDQCQLPDGPEREVWILEKVQEHRARAAEKSRLEAERLQAEVSAGGDALGAAQTEVAKEQARKAAEEAAAAAQAAKEAVEQLEIQKRATRSATAAEKQAAEEKAAAEAAAAKAAQAEEDKAAAQAAAEQAAEEKAAAEQALADEKAAAEAAAAQAAQAEEDKAAAQAAAEQAAEEKAAAEQALADERADKDAQIQAGIAAGIAAAPAAAAAGLGVMGGGGSTRGKKRVLSQSEKDDRKQKTLAKKVEKKRKEEERIASIVADATEEATKAESKKAAMEKHAHDVVASNLSAALTNLEQNAVAMELIMDDKIKCITRISTQLRNLREWIKADDSNNLEDEEIDAIANEGLEEDESDSPGA
jgi:hypothetical protein